MNAESYKSMKLRKRLLIEVFMRIPYRVGIRMLSLFFGNSLVQGILFGQRKRVLGRLYALIGKPDDERKALTRHLLSNLALPWIVGALARCDDREFQRWVRVENESILDSEKAKGHGILVVGCHTGVSRLVPWFLMRKWDDVSAMEPEPWLAKMGVRDGGRVHSIIMRGEGEKFWLKQLFQARKALAEKQTVHVALDGLQGTGGKPRNFLGRQRVFHIGLSQVALTMSVPIVQALSGIDEQGKVTIRFLNPLAAQNADLDIETRLEGFLDRYSAALEDLWRTDPGNIQARHLRHYLASEPAPDAEHAKTPGKTRVEELKVV